MIPFLEVSNRLAQRGHAVTFVVPRIRIDRHAGPARGGGTPERRRPSQRPASHRRRDRSRHRAPQQGVRRSHHRAICSPALSWRSDRLCCHQPPTAGLVLDRRRLTGSFWNSSRIGFYQSPTKTGQNMKVCNMLRLLIVIKKTIKNYYQAERKTIDFQKQYKR
jgi:hypothetical protein